MWTDQRDFGLRAAWVGPVQLLRATDSSTPSHCSGKIVSHCSNFFLEKPFQHCQLPKLCMHGNFRDRGNLLHSVSVQLKGTTTSHNSCLKNLFNNVQTRVGALTGVAQQVLGHVALFQLPVTRKPHKMGPISQGDKVIGSANSIF